jgi:ferric-dicitrate binding protein FerR (iron transport regulator)
MDNPGQYDDLLTKYLLNELNSREKDQVSRWIDGSEDNRAYFERFKAIWNFSALGHSMDTIDVDQEWHYHKRIINGDEFIPGLKEYSREIYKAEKPEGGKLHRFWVNVAAAASILLVLGLGIYLVNRHEMTIAGTHPSEQHLEKVPLADLPPVHTEINASGRSRKLMLEDGSRVVLFAHSEMRYEKIFAGNSREIQLKGKADFKVFRNKTKPFTVHAGDISITALGTEFTVTAFERAAIKSVKLYEGKVVIRSSTSASKKLNKDFYLLPGQEFVYDNQKATAVVRRFRVSGSGDGNDKSGNSDDLLLPEDLKGGSWFMFNNQSLPEVLTQLQGMFNADIEYKKADLEKMYFIGKFSKADSLEDILNRMTILYHLKLTKENNKYLISK